MIQSRVLFLKDCAILLLRRTTLSRVIAMKISGRIERFFGGEAIHSEKPQPQSGTRISIVTPQRLLLFFVLTVGCGIYDPGQRDWSFKPLHEREDVEDASFDAVDEHSVETGMDTENSDRDDTDVDAKIPETDDDSCIASDEVCDGEDNDCDGETDGQKASDNCNLDNAIAICEAGECVIDTCEDPYEDCDQEDKNGCEALLTELENCGECGLECKIENAVATCSSGRCELDTCDDLFEDCNDDPSDGCEISLNSTKHCDRCDYACPEPEIGSGSSYVCDNRECKLIDCESGWANCDDDPETSCDTDIFNSFENCGHCGRDCNPFSSDRCIEGDCSCGERGRSCLWPEVCCEGGNCRLSC